MEEMGRIMNNPNNADRHTAPVMEEVRNPNFDRNSQELLKKTTGLDMSGVMDQEPTKEDRYEYPDKDRPSADTNIPQVYPPNRDIPIGAKVNPDGTWSKTYDNVDQDIYNEAIQKADKKMQDNSAKNDLLAAAVAAASDEEERLGHAAASLDDEEKVRDLYENDPRADGLNTRIDASGNRVKMDADGIPNIQYTQDDVVVTRRKDDVKNLVDPVDSYESGSTYDLTPSYEYEEEANPNQEDDNKHEVEDTDSQQFGEYLSTLEATVPTFDKSLVQVTKNRQIDIVPSNRNKSGKYLNDQAFMNSITKFKKDNFTTVSIPLVNSGFTIEIVGTGPIDLINLYYRVTENTTSMEYELEKMRAVMRNVVGTHPRIDPMQLRNMIHYADYDLMSYAHVCATLDKVENLYNCDECGKPFRVTSDSKTMILNYDEIHKKAMEFDQADDIDRYSLLTKNYKFTTEGLFEITIGHPSYSDNVHIKEQIKAYSEQLKSPEKERFIGMEDTLIFIRSIKMPNGVITSNAYQVFSAMNMLTPGDLFYIEKQIEKLRSAIIHPQFGMRDVICPHCGKHISEITYEKNSLNDLVFYHALVTRLLMEADQSEKSGENGRNE